MNKLRKHTIIVTRDDDSVIIGMQLIKDWYSNSFADGYDYRVMEDRPQGLFFFCGFHQPISQSQAKCFTDAILMGKIKTYDLSQYGR